MYYFERLPVDIVFCKGLVHFRVHWVDILGDVNTYRLIVVLKVEKIRRSSSCPSHYRLA